MKRMWIPLATALSVISSAGCSSNYWPIREDDSLFLWIRAGDEPIEIDGDVFRASLEMCLRPADLEWPCGTRLVPEGYDQDSFVIDQDEIGSFELECWKDGDISNGYIDGHCRSLAQKADEGMEFRAIVNDALVARLTMPARTRPTSPKNGSVISVSSVDGIPLSWTPGKPEEALRWEMHETFSVSGGCGPDVVWSEESHGDLEDVGSFTIPKEVLPTNLPPEGCSTEIVLTRSRDGILEPVMKNGWTKGQQYGAVQVLLKP